MKKFIDEEFPSEIALKDFKNLKFFRPEQIYKSFTLFPKIFTIHQIFQGSLGNCYLISSFISIIHKNPNLIKNLFISNEINLNGFYKIKLFISGKWKIITIDDLFPFKGNFPAFSRTNSNDIWIFLLEKAFAKIYGSYLQIENGNPSIALSILTGIPTENFYEKSSKEFKEIIVEMLKKSS